MQFLDVCLAFAVRLQSVSHTFLDKAILAAPASFFSSDVASQLSRTHFRIKLFCAVPDSFFSVAWDMQALSAAKAEKDRIRVARRTIRVFTRCLSVACCLVNE